MKAFAALFAMCAFALAGTVAAQTAPPADTKPLARASTTEVALDVVVLDKHGKPVKNLKPGDLQVLEDEVPQQVTSFRFVPVNESQQQITQTAQGGGAVKPVSRLLRSVNLICLVFHNLDPVTRNRAIQVAREFLQNELTPDTYVGMFTLGDRLNAVYPFSNNRKELAQAVDKVFVLRPMDFTRASEAVLTANPTMVTATVALAGSGPATSATVDWRVSGGEISNTVIADAAVSTDVGASTMRGNQVTENRDFSDIHGMRETDKIVNMVTQFGRLPGRKEVLLLSTGLHTTGDPDRFEAMVNKANANHVTIYSIDVSGLTEVSTVQAGNLAVGQVASVSRSQGDVATAGTGIPQLAAAKEKSRQGDTMNDAVRNSDVQASLRALAEGTGGFLIANTNEFHKPFTRIVDDMETHYELTYRPTSDRYDGRLRTIAVKAPSHADWKVESRTGYFAMPALKDTTPLLPYEVIALAQLGSKPLPHAFDLHAAVFNFKSEGQSREGALVVELPGAALTPAKGPNGVDRLRNQVLALVKDSTGQVVDKFSMDAPYEIADDKVAELRKTPLVYTHALELPPGKYTVETVAMDREGGRASTATTEFDTSDSTTGLGMSSALLIRRLEPSNGQADSGPLMFHGRRLVPFVGTELTADVNPYAYFVVYPDKSNAEKPKLQVEFKVDGNVMANQTADLPSPDPSGAIPMVIRAAVHTGKCELKIAATQGSERTERVLTYTVK